MPTANHFKVKVNKEKGVIKSASKKSKTYLDQTENDDSPTEDFQVWNIKNETNNLEDVIDINESEIAEKGDFSNFPLNEALIEKLKLKGIQKLFPVQYLSFDSIFQGKDVIVQARTGTGKTLAFALPIIEKISNGGDHKATSGRTPKAIILAPTRELANQIANDFSDVAPPSLSILAVYGGTAYDKQIQSLRKGVDVVVGTPGRVMDHMNCGNLDISNVKYVVLDEVDEMLDMGFRDDVETIIKELYTTERANFSNLKKENSGEVDGSGTPQTLLFSATLPAWVHQTAKKYLRDDVFHLSLINDKSVRTSTTVKHLAIQCHWKDRSEAIGSVIQFYSCGPESRSIVFCERKCDADELAGHPAIPDAHVLHGDIKQETRESILQKFRDGKHRVLVTTNVAARGLDIPDIDLVVQCKPPKNVEQYIHRCGRTGRAERTGVSVLFYTMNESDQLRAVESRAGIQFERTHVPSAGEIAQSQQSVVFKVLKDIPESAWSLFSDSAQALIDELGAERAIAAALAKISHATEAVKQRSLITCAEGYTSYLLKTTNTEVKNKGYAYAALRRHLPDNVSESIRGLQFLKDKTGFVFDLPCTADSVVEDHWEDGRYDSLSKLTQIPELQEPTESSRGGGSFNGNRGRGRGRGGGGFGFSRGGGGDRGRGRGSRGGFQRGGFSSNMNGGIKRSNSSLGSDAQSKKIKFE